MTLLGACMTGVGAGQPPSPGAADKPLPCERLGVLELRSVREPSGVCYHSGRKTLFVVDDSGVICECTTAGEIVRQKHLGNLDFEGITHDPATGWLYVAVEGPDSILEVHPETLEARREFAVPRSVNGRTLLKEGGQGLEAIAFVPDPLHPHGGTFLVANQGMNLQKKSQDVSGIFEVEAPVRAEGKAQPDGARIVRFFLPELTDIAGLWYDSAQDIVYAVSDSEDRVVAFTRTGRRLQSWSLPGVNQEGIAVDANGCMYIAQDSGGVLKLKVDWDRVKAAVGNGERGTVR